MDIRTGSEIYGPTKHKVYEVIELIGHGSFGLVFAIANKAGKKYALKTIPKATLSETALKALINEGVLATKVNHENVLRVLFFHDGNLYPSLPLYMIMEYAEQGTLESVLDERKSKREHFNQEVLKDLFTQLASGMKAVNEVLVHRDIKPDNILISNGKLKIADFGLSKFAGAATRSSTLKGINHIRYCAPEAWRSEKNLFSMDMYSMGIVFYELATLTPPFQVSEQGDSVENWKNAHFSQPVRDPRSLNSALDLSLAQVILKMVSKRPEDRYKDWDEVINRIQSGGVDSPPTIDTRRLVEKVLMARQEAEKERLEAEQETREAKGHLACVEGAFAQVRTVAVSVVDSFNGSNDFVKLHLADNRSLAFDIRCPKGRIDISVQPEITCQTLDNAQIKAYGVVKSSSGRGFNLVLIASSEGDPYGSWRTLHVRHHALVRQHDGRPEPFPFEFKELPIEIELINALHIYCTKRDSLKAEMFLSLIEELLC